MIPQNTEFIDVEVIRQPTFTYQLNFERNRIIKYIDGLPAMRQFVYKALQTNRYQHEIYDWNYGFEIDDLMGKPLSYAKAKLPGRIIDALITDDRVLAIEDFIFTEPADSVISSRKTTVCIGFTVKTIYGDLKEEYVRDF